MSDVTVSRKEYDQLLADRRRIDLIELCKKAPRWNENSTGALTFRQAVDEMEKRQSKAPW